MVKNSRNFQKLSQNCMKIEEFVKVRCINFLKSGISWRNLMSVTQDAHSITPNEYYAGQKKRNVLTNFDSKILDPVSSSNTIFGKYLIYWLPIMMSTSPPSSTDGILGRHDTSSSPLMSWHRFLMFSSPALRLYRGKVAVIFCQANPFKIVCSPEVMSKQMTNSGSV